MKITSAPFGNNVCANFIKSLKEKTRTNETEDVKPQKKGGFADFLTSSYFMYRLKTIGKDSYSFNYDLLEKSGIPNLHPLNDNGVRGGTLSGKKGRKFIPLLKKAGIKSVIDLRGEDASSSYEELCKKNGLNYYNIPISSEGIKTEDLQKLFETMNKGRFYIACAQGLHRTDIAVAINYIFNPKASAVPPKMYGHVSQSKFKSQEIFAHTNSIFKSLTDEDKRKLGLSEFNKENYLRKKMLLARYNEIFAAKSQEPEKVTV